MSKKSNQEKLNEIHEIAQKMKNGEIKPAKKYESIKSFIDDLKKK